MRWSELHCRLWALSPGRQPSGPRPSDTFVRRRTPRAETPIRVRDRTASARAHSANFLNDGHQYSYLKLLYLIAPIYYLHNRLMYYHFVLVRKLTPYTIAPTSKMFRGFLTRLVSSETSLRVWCCTLDACRFGCWAPGLGDENICNLSTRLRSEMFYWRIINVWGARTFLTEWEFRYYK